jgi:hypothetical protein
MATHPKCGKSWTGARLEHCPVCCETFSSTASGDMHRVGDHNESVGPDRRRCLDPEEMLAAGMARNHRGHWVTKPWDGPSGSTVSPQEAGEGSVR